MIGADPDALRARDRPLVADFQSELTALQTADAVRVQRMRDYREEAEAHRDAVLTRDTGDYGRPVDDQQERLRHRVRLPYAVVETIKHTYRSCGRAPDVGVPRADSTSRELHRQRMLELLLAASYDSSKEQVQINDAGWDASLLGAGGLEVSFNVKLGLPTFRSVAPETCHVVPGAHEPHDYQRVYRSWRAPAASVRRDYGGIELDGLEGGVNVGALGTEAQIEEIGGVQHVVIHQVTDAESCIRWSGDVVLYRQQHDYGFVPAVFFPNVGPQRRIWGLSDYELVRSVAFYYEALISRQADAVAYASSPAYTESGTGVHPSLIQRIMRTGGVLPKKRDGVIEPIAQIDQPAFVNQHLEMVRTALDDLGFTPPAAWGALAGQTSGSERGMAMNPAVELTRLKQVNLAWALERINEMTLRLWESKSVDTRSYRGSTRRHGVLRGFRFTVGPDAAAPEPSGGELTQAALEDRDPAPLPMTPSALIEGDYRTTVRFDARLDVHDPQFILAEMNKYAQAAQSLQTTLANLGVEDPQQEIELIASEAERYPWMRQGMIALIQQQLGAQQAAQAAPGGGQGPGLESDDLAAVMGGDSPSGALGLDMLSRSLNGSADEGGRRPGAPMGALFGGA